jgi:hypothetical protein
MERRNKRHETILDSNKIHAHCAGGDPVFTRIYLCWLGHAEIFSEEDRDKLRGRWSSMWHWVTGENDAEETIK